MKSLFVFCVLAQALLTPDERAVLESKMPAPPEVFVEGGDGMRFPASEIAHLLTDPAANRQEALAAITDFHAQLKSHGIRLIVVPVPPKAAILPASLDTRLKAASLGRADDDFLKTLQEDGVEVVDLSDAFRKETQPVFCARDSHWNGHGIDIAARLISGRIGPASNSPFVSKSERMEIQGDLGGEKETVEITKVASKAGGERIDPDRHSRVLVLGDSHVLVFHDGGDMHATGAGLPDQLTLRLGIPVDVLGVRGSGATPARVNLARRARADASYLREKKVVVWCFAAREWTQAPSWQKVPLLPK